MEVSAPLKWHDKCRWVQLKMVFVFTLMDKLDINILLWQKRKGLSISQKIGFKIIEMKLKAKVNQTQN